MKMLAAVLFSLLAVNASAQTSDAEKQSYVSFASESNLSQAVVFTPTNTLHTLTDKSISHRNSIHHDFYGIFSKEKFQKIYLDDEGNVVLTKTALGELSMSDKMLIKR